MVLQFPALESSFGLSPILPPAPGSSSFFSVCVRRTIPSVIRTVPVQKRVCGGAILIFNLCLSTTQVYFAFCPLLEELDSAALIFLPFPTSLHAFVTVSSHEELNESRRGSGEK